MRDNCNIKVEGFLKVYDPDSEEVYYDGHNAIHYENMSVALAQGLANTGQGFVYEMVFGNGGTTVDPTGIITYLTPNTIGVDSTLYNETYSKVISPSSPNNTDPTRNTVGFSHVSGKNYSDVIISCLLDYTEPTDQFAFDNATDTSSQYVFDEIGLRGYNPTGTGKLLTHVIFHPTQKALNRRLGVNYVVRIQSLTGFNEV